MSRMILRHIAKRYDNGAAAVEDFNLEVEEGEFIILVGPSGCGKSTTLRMIAGLEDITSGELWIDGKLVNFLAPGERGLSMVFQNYALYPHMSIYDNMAFSLQIRKMPKKEIDQRVRTAARLLNIENLLDRRPAEVSGGQRQRVAIGSVLVREPGAYLMDEPLSNLDAKLRAQMRVELKNIHEKLHATVLYVTHDQVEAMTLGTRIVVMNQGHVQQIAPPEELYRNPINQFVAGFIGSPSMNIMDAAVLEERGHAWLDIGGQRLRLPDDLGNVLFEKGYRGKDIRIGIRPEDLKPIGTVKSDLPASAAAHSMEENASGDIWQERFPDSDRLVMDVQVRELLGAEVLLHGVTERFKTSVKAAPDCSICAGERAVLQINFEHVLFFDTETEENILYGIRKAAWEAQQSDSAKKADSSEKKTTQSAVKKAQTAREKQAAVCAGGKDE